jgi:RNA polymerase sigma factor (sigma-70 family)
VARLANSKMTSLQGSRRGDGFDIDVPDGTGGPLAALLSSEVSGILREALEELDPRERQVIMLTFVEEQSLSEVGRALGVTESRICQIRARALRTLRRSLSNSGITEARDDMLA